MLKFSVFRVLVSFCFCIIETSNQKCPPLVTEFSQDNCTSKSGDMADSYYLDFDENSCVPKCKKYQEEIYKNCQADSKCMPGYACVKRCGPDDNMKQLSCEKDSDCAGQGGDNDTSPTCDFYCMAENKESCMAYHINTKDYKDTYWSAENFKPSCNNDGTWKAKQCKGGLAGRCMCFDSEGKRIFGEAPNTDASNMTCACSRRKAELDAQRATTLHCDPMGNYEALQCDKISEQCWCVEPTTGNLVSTVVPEKAINLLPCYSVEIYGTQYLRQCESKKFAQTRIKHKLNTHGVTYVVEDFLLCDDDGAYGPYEIESDSAYCTWRDNAKIGSWQSPIESGISDLNCNCARDYHRYENRQSCLSSGNYKPLQNDMGNWYCIDQDGFLKSSIFVDPVSTEDTYCSQYY